MLPVAAAAGAVAVLTIVAAVALHTGAGQRLDQRSMDTVVASRETKIAVLGGLGYVSIGAMIAVAVACVLLAVAQGRIRLVAGAAVTIIGANVTTQLLKHVVLDRTTFDVVAVNSLPSGHATVVASAVGALLIAAPRPARLLLVVPGSFAVMLTGASLIVAGWHRPADVIAALAVCLAWTAVGAVVAGGAHRGAAGVALGSLVGSGGALLLLIAIGVRPAYGWSGFGEAALVLGVMAVATAFTVTLMERVSPSAQP
jgi:membrane-associated phospholipid phosphatase